MNYYNYLGLSDSTYTNIKPLLRYILTRDLEYYDDLGIHPNVLNNDDRVYELEVVQPFPEERTSGLIKFKPFTDDLISIDDYGLQINKFQNYEIIITPIGLPDEINSFQATMKVSVNYGFVGFPVITMQGQPSYWDGNYPLQFKEILAMPRVNMYNGRSLSFEVNQLDPVNGLKGVKLEFKYSKYDPELYCKKSSGVCTPFYTVKDGKRVVDIKYQLLQETLIREQFDNMIYNTPFNTRMRYVGPITGSTWDTLCIKK